MAFGDGVMEGLEPVGTGGYANNGGFRPALLEMAVAEGKSITFVGIRENGPSSTEHPQANLRKHSGFSAIRLEDLVLIAIGSAIEQAVTDFKRQNPAAQVVLADHLARSITRGHDNLMPNAAGYQAMAEVWYQAIQPYLK